MRKILYIQGINPEPWTAPDLSIGWRAGRKPYPQASTGALQRAYQEGLKESITEAYPDIEMFPEGVPLRLQLFFWRQLDQYVTEKGRKMTRKIADSTNIQKATEDALQGILYKNDTQIVWPSSRFVQHSQDAFPAILIVVSDVFPMPVWKSYGEVQSQVKSKNEFTVIYQEDEYDDV